MVTKNNKKTKYLNKNPSHNITITTTATNEFWKLFWKLTEFHNKLVFYIVRKKNYSTLTPLFLSFWLSRAMTDRLALQFARPSPSLGLSASNRIPIPSKCQFQLPFPFSFSIAHSPLCSGSGLLQRISPINVLSNSLVNEAEPKELRDESDFEAIFSDSDYISVCGFGSLLSGMCDWSNKLTISYSWWLILWCLWSVCLTSLSLSLSM